MESVIRLNRRRVLVGAAGAGLATTLGATLAFAQDVTPTPSTGTTDPNGSATPSAGTSGIGTATESTLLQQVDDAITSAQADVAAVGNAVDLSVVQQLLTAATGLRDRLAAAPSGTDDSASRRLARAAITTADAASDLLKAHLSNYGLPSQQDRASRILAAAYDRIQALSTSIDTSQDADAATFVTTAQTLYQSAYDLFNAGTYAGAAGTAEVAAEVGEVAAILTGASGPDGIGGFDSSHGGHGGQSRGKSGDNGDNAGNSDQSDETQDDTSDTPDTQATPPAPTF